MKKTILINPLVSVQYFILPIMGIYLISYLAITNPNGIMIVIVILLKVLVVVGVIFGLKFASEFNAKMMLFSDGIKTKLGSSHNTTYVPLSEIKEVVIHMAKVYEPGYDMRMVLSVNSKNGVILGWGRIALRALLKNYPDMKFRVCHWGWEVGKKNLIMLARRGCLGKYKIKTIAKRYHLPEDFAVAKQDDLVNNTDQ